MKQTFLNGVPYRVALENSSKHKTSLCMFKRAINSVRLQFYEFDGTPNVLLFKKKTDRLIHTKYIPNQIKTFSFLTTISS